MKRLLIALLLALSLAGCVSAADDPVRAETARVAIESTDLGPVVHEVSATDDGEVRIVLSVRKDSLGAGVVASDACADLAEAIYRSDNTTTRVTVFDGDMHIIDSYKPK